MSLNTFPDELLLKILHDFDAHDNKRDLVSLARSSRRLYDLATPFLYKRLNDGEPVLPHLLPHLLRSLLRNRALGGHAEEMTIHAQSLEDPLEDISALTAADWALAKEAIAELYNHEIWDVWPAGMLDDKPNYSRGDTDSVPPSAENRTQEYCEHWYACVAAGRWDAVCALVLALLPSLSHLAIENWDVWGYRDYSVFGEDRDYVSRLMRGAANAQAQAIAMEAERRERDPQWDAYLLADVLPYLSSVNVEYHDYRYGMRIFHMLPFVLPPLVERFQVSSVANDGLEGAPKLELGLKSLSILHSNMSAEDLGGLIECCPRLEKLVYVPGGALVGYAAFAPSLLMPGLRSVRGTLTELDLAQEDGVIDFDVIDFSFYDPLPSEVMLGSLRDFAKLKRLRLRVEHLIGEKGFLGPARLWEKLPRSLWRLTIKGEECEGLLNIIPDLQALLQRKDEAVPALRQIHLGDVRRKTESDDEQVRSLRNSCEAHGVQLFIQYPYNEQEEFISGVLQGMYR